MEISGFENIISIEQFEYSSTINEHEKCRFVCCANDIDSLLKLVDLDCTCKNGKFSFEGHITEVTVSKDISGNSIEVCLIGKTYLYDMDSHNRIFQNNEKTLSAILSKLESMTDVKHESKQEKPIKGILMQKDISDWKFAIQMAKMLGEYVFAGKNTFIGSHGVNKIDLAEEECIDYKYSIFPNDVRMVCRINKNINLGDVVNYNGKELFVCQKRYILEREQYYYEYCLHKTKESKDTYDIYNDELLEAVIKDNNDPDRKGRVKVSFANENIKDCMENDAVWIERASFYSSDGDGAVFIPAIDDKVIVKLINGKGIVIGSLQTEAYNSVVNNQDSKYIVMDENVYVGYEDGCLMMVNKENKLILSDGKVTINMGKEAKLEMDSEKACIQIGKSAIEISKDMKVSANKYLVESKSEASISASNVNIKGKSGVNIN